MKFEPDRLLILRQIKKFSLRELGEKVGLSHTAISKYEKGKDIPRPAVIVKLAKIFEVSTSYFFKPFNMEVSSISYRKTSALNKKAQKSLEGQVKEHIEKYSFIEEITGSEKHGKILNKKFIILEIADAEKAAEKLRHEWDLGSNPLPNVTELLEDKGIKVVFIDFADSFNGLSMWVNETIPIIVCNRTHPGDRQRFTLLYELGHMVMDIPDDVSEESVAHRFAAAFLVPQKILMEKIGEKRTSIHLDELLILKQEYGMSLQALVRRCFDLAIIGKPTYTKFMKEFSRRGWREEEPGNRILSEKSFRFQLLLKRAIAENLITPSQTMELLGILPSLKDSVAYENIQKAAMEARDLYANEEITIFTCSNVEDIFSYDD